MMSMRYARGLSSGSLVPEGPPISLAPRSCADAILRAQGAGVRDPGLSRESYNARCAKRPKIAKLAANDRLRSGRHRRDARAWPKRGLLASRRGPTLGDIVEPAADRPSARIAE